MKIGMNPWPKTRGSDSGRPATINLKELASCRRDLRAISPLDLQKGLTFHTGCGNFESVWPKIPLFVRRVRVSVGLEASSDLLADLDQALAS